MIAPIEHHATPLDVDEQTLSEMMQGARLMMQALEIVYLHVVPRWRGDTNFMTGTGDVRVIPESLEAAHEKLKGARTRVIEERGIVHG